MLNIILSLEFSTFRFWFWWTHGLFWYIFEKNLSFLLLGVHTDSIFLFLITSFLTGSTLFHGFLFRSIIFYLGHVFLNESCAFTFIEANGVFRLWLFNGTANITTWFRSNYICQIIHCLLVECVIFLINFSWFHHRCCLLFSFVECGIYVINICWFQLIVDIFSLKCNFWKF